MSGDLRETIARQIADEEAATRGALPYADTSWACVRGRWLPKADRLLTLPEMAAILADAERVQRVRELANRLDSHHAPYCCTVACPEPNGRHGDPTDPVRIRELVGILGDNPPPLVEHRTIPCPEICTCPAGADVARIREALDGDQS